MHANHARNPRKTKLITAWCILRGDRCKFSQCNGSAPSAKFNHSLHFACKSIIQHTLRENLLISIYANRRVDKGANHCSAFAEYRVWLI